MQENAANGGSGKKKEERLRWRAATEAARRAKVPRVLSNDPEIRARQIAQIDELVFPLSDR